MKTLYLGSIIASLFSLSAFAQTNDNIEESLTSFASSTTSIEQKLGATRRSSTVIYNNPTVRVNNSYRNMFVGSLTGNQFCKERGHKQEVTGSTIKCGEDESAYANYDWYDSQWVLKSTGSKNQCYPLYASIKCGN
ncbi:hypothetical protein [Pseudoalteromonas sp. Ld20]|uniref:hypothetical protein n=1 Tax=Pseudoalteromonas sp. Ld20 TaxID=649165 RepID=UPI00386D7054